MLRPIPVFKTILDIFLPPFRHFSHEHKLHNRIFSSECFCNMCNGRISGGVHHYYCPRCNYYIHEQCAEWPEHIDHSFYPPHRLTLQSRSLEDNVNRCYYCEKPFQNDEYLYACEQLCSDFYMHRACAMIPVPTIMSNIDGSEEHNVVRFSCHQQPMILVDHRDGHKRRAKCFACQSNRSGPMYSCISSECDNFIHKSCSELPQKIQHPFHSPHSLILQVSQPQSCRSCCKQRCILAFGCPEDWCNFNLCIECVSLHLTVKCQSHGLLSLVEKSSCEIQCDACHKSYETGIEVVPEEFNYTDPYCFVAWIALITSTFFVVHYLVPSNMSTTSIL